MYDSLKQYLGMHEKARERKYRSRGLVYFLMRQKNIVPLEVNDVVSFKNSNALENFCMDYVSAERAWRKIMQDVPSLRGKDYGETDGSKVELEENYQKDLGYGGGGYKAAPYPGGNM